MQNFSKNIGKKEKNRKTQTCMVKVKDKSIPLHGFYEPTGFQEVEAPRIQAKRLSALWTGRLFSPGNISGTHFCQRMSRPQGHSEAERIMSMKNSNDTMGNQIRDLPTCSPVPQPTALPPAPNNASGSQTVTGSGGRILDQLSNVIFSKRDLCHSCC